MRTFLELVQCRLLRVRDYTGNDVVRAEIEAVMDRITAKLAEPLDAEDENETLKSDLAATLDAADSFVGDIRAESEALEDAIEASDDEAALRCNLKIHDACEAWESYKAALIGEPTEPGTQQVPS